MRTLLFFIPFIICFGCSYDDSCMSARDDDYSLGELRYFERSLKFLPYDTLDSIPVSNDKGYEDTMVVKSSYSEVREIINKIKPGECSTEDRYIYYSSEKFWVIEGLQQNFKFHAGLIKNLPDTFTKYIKPIEIKDLVYLEIFERDFYFSPEGEEIKIRNKNDYIFHDQLQLNGKSYTEVYELIGRHDGRGKLHPDKVYYSGEKGIIGWIFSNGDKWFIND